MPAGDELTGPVGYSAVWGWLALAAVLVVVAWYAGVAWWARPRRRPAADRPAPLPDVRQRHLAELDRIEQDVLARPHHRAGRLPADQPHRAHVRDRGERGPGAAPWRSPTCARPVSRGWPTRSR